MGSPAAGLAAGLATGLAATLAAGLVMPLAEGLAGGWAAALGVGLAAGLAGAPAPVASNLAHGHRTTLNATKLKVLWYTPQKYNCSQLHSGLHHGRRSPGMPPLAKRGGG